MGRIVMFLLLSGFNIFGAERVGFDYHNLENPVVNFLFTQYEIKTRKKLTDKQKLFLIKKIIVKFLENKINKKYCSNSEEKKHVESDEEINKWDMPRNKIISDLVSKL